MLIVREPANMETVISFAVPRQRGFSLVEVLVAMVIALVGVTVIFQVFALSESTRRTATGGGDAQQSGALALFSIERDLRQAGYGANVQSLVGCVVQGYDTARVPQTFTFRFTPVIITANAAAVPDALTVFYGSSPTMINPPRLVQNQITDTSTPVRVGNIYGYSAGDVILMADMTIPAPNCMLGQVTGVAADVITHDNTNYVTPTGGAATARYNRPGGVPGMSTLTTNAYVHNLGTQPVLNSYSVINNQLTVLAWGGTTQAVADSIVLLKAQYGKDNGINNGTVQGSPNTAGDGIIDSFDTTVPATGADWARVIAVRIAVVARSVLPEIPTAGRGQPCDATTAFPQWAGGALDVSADANWRCHRYKVFETTVPLRNMLWWQPAQ